MSTSIIDFLLERRSLTAKDLCEPGPSDDQLDIILKAGHRVPDHGKIGPWRFIVFQGGARKTFGNKLARKFEKKHEDATQKLLEFERDRFLRAPLVIAVVSSPIDHPKVPEWEQVLSAGAVCQNILLAAHALGFGAQWLTEWYAYDKRINKKLSLTSEEQVAGFIYIGSYKEKPEERNRPDLNERITFYRGKK
ncbi:nitroreductase family protein [Teredinibacter franksiae]|uniref:nitroreductase family protein n=1 Tax=Teredinibacter franksiae TaxID=2761453 RepID=UPI001628ED83|nr:nitroreductase [Teredinibacter franksiae]